MVQKIYLTLSRFPFSALCVFFSYFVSMSFLHDKNYLSLSSIFFILFCGFFFFLGLKFFIERDSYKYKEYYAFGMSLFLLLSIYLYMVDPNWILSRIFFSLGIFLLSLGVPFLNLSSSTLQMVTFFYLLLRHGFFTFLVTGSLFIGSILILSTFRFLFEVPMYQKIYGDVFIFFFTLVAPLFFLTGVPTLEKSRESIKVDYAGFLLTYILIPLFVLYALLFYGYLAKIIFTWILPRGEITYLVLGFLCVGMFLYVASFIPYKKQRRVLDSFQVFYFSFLPAPLMLMGVAIGIRIYSYGMTYHRYIVLFALEWGIFSTVWSFSKYKDLTPKVVIFSLVFFLIAASLIQLVEKIN